MSKTWRELIAPQVAKVIHQHQGETVKEIRAALREAYPYERPPHGWLYKIWLSESRIQLGLEPDTKGKRAQVERLRLTEAGQQEMDL